MQTWFWVSCRTIFKKKVKKPSKNALTWVRTLLLSTAIRLAKINAKNILMRNFPSLDGSDPCDKMYKISNCLYSTLPDVSCKFLNSIFSTKGSRSLWKKRNLILEHLTNSIWLRNNLMLLLCSCGSWCNRRSQRTFLRSTPNQLAEQNSECCNWKISFAQYNFIEARFCYLYFHEWICSAARIARVEWSSNLFSLIKMT